MTALLSVEDLTIAIGTGAPVVAALSLSLARGETLGLVGESGSGKTVTALAVMGLLGPGARVTAGVIRIAGRDVSGRAPGARGAAMVFQNPRSALHPLRPVGAQLGDVIARHSGGTGAARRAAVRAALTQVRVPDPDRVAAALPLELSGGTCQRVLIAMALAAQPDLLIADEPTTGLDVTTQAEVMEVITSLARDRGLGTLLITHDLTLAAGVCDRIAVIHAGHLIETGPVAAIFATPRHPYSAMLLQAAPGLAGTLADLRPIPGQAPDLAAPDLPACRFAPRCPRALAACAAGPFPARPVGPSHLVACRNPL